MMTLGKRMWRGFVFVSVVLVFVPAGWFVFGLGAAFFAPVIFETAFSTFYVYAFLPSAMFLTYPDVSPKLGIPHTLFGLSVTFLYWFVVSLILGALLGVLRVSIGSKKSSEPTGSDYRPPAAGSA
ncbi:MAG: hypothetical protein L6437_05850 [Kiritimatiellae bacterium]|nr:hypothetical protein [Kiritimatiellia bacterium]